MKIEQIEKEAAENADHLVSDHNFPRNVAKAIYDNEIFTAWRYIELLTGQKPIHEKP